MRWSISVAAGSRNSALSIRVQPTRCRRNSPVGITTPPTPARASPARSAGASCPAAPAPVSARAHPRGSRPDYHQIIVKRNYESSRATAQPVSHRSDLRYPPRSTSQTTPSTRSRAPSRLRRSATLAAPCSTGKASRLVPKTQRRISGLRRRPARGSAPPPSEPRSSSPPRSSATFTAIPSRQRSARSSSARSLTTNARPSRRSSWTAGRRWLATTKR